MINILTMTTEREYQEYKRLSRSIKANLSRRVAVSFFSSALVFVLVVLAFQYKIIEINLPSWGDRIEEKTGD